MTEDLYVRRLLAAYRELPDASGRARAADRRLAVQLFRDQVPLELVTAAFQLALDAGALGPRTCRRSAPSDRSTISCPSSTRLGPSIPATSTTSSSEPSTPRLIPKVAATRANSHLPAVSRSRQQEEERPRERLLKNGAQVLSDAELLAVLLKNGRPGASVLDLARELLRESGGLAGLTAGNALSLRRRGVGPVKLACLLAAVELACRLAQARIPDREPLNRPASIARYVALRYGARDQEVMGALFVDIRNRLLGEREMYRGTLNRAAVEPREILKEGLLRGAAGVVLFHNHPSGDPSPSGEDVLFTRRMAEAGEVVGVRLVDHLVIGAGGAWCSLRDRGAW